MRARGTVASIEQVDGGLLVEFDTTVEVEGRSKPGFVVRWRQLWSAEPHARSWPRRASPHEGTPGAIDVVVVTVPFDEFPHDGRPRPSAATGWPSSPTGRTRSRSPPQPSETRSWTAGSPAPLSELHLVTLLDHLVNPVVHPSGETWFGWNYGLDDVRFGGSVRAG